MGAWALQLSPQLADLTRVHPGQRVLDVGCGPGALTSELVARVGAEAVAAVDPSMPFVAAARARYPGVDVGQAHAETLPYPDGSFHAALAQLVVHFMADPVGGLREMARVTRRGGTVAACVWAFGTGRGPLGPFWQVARELDASVDDESRRPGTGERHLVELFRAAGLTDIEEAVLSASREYASFEDWWEPFTRGVGPAGAYVERLAAEQRAELRERCRSMLPDGAFVLRAQAWAARGTVP